MDEIGDSIPVISLNGADDLVLARLEDEEGSQGKVDLSLIPEGFAGRVSSEKNGRKRWGFESKRTSLNRNDYL